MKPEHYKTLAIVLGTLLVIAVFFTAGVLIKMGLLGRDAPPGGDLAETPAPATPAIVTPAPVTPAEPAPAPTPPLPPTARGRPGARAIPVTRAPAPTRSPAAGGTGVVTGGGAQARPSLQLSPATVSTLQLATLKSPGTIAWSKFADGCDVAFDNDILQIRGTVGNESRIHWNGIITDLEFPEGDFVFSAEYKAPSVQDPRLHEISITALNDTTFGNLHFSLGGGYWLEFGPQNTQNVRTFGNEASAFHRMSLQYNAATTEFAAWADDSPPAKARRPLAGKKRFALALCTEPGAVVDVQFQKIQLLTGAEATKALRK